MGVFDKAKRKVKELDRLEKLKTDLEKLGPIPPMSDDIYPYAIKYFNIIAKFQDAGPIIRDDFKNNIKEIDVFLEHIENSGRNSYGWVRAKPGEPVTMKNLYLGDVAGIWTNTAETFKNSKDPDVKKIIYRQLSSFIKSHLGPLQSNLDKILKKDRPNLFQKLISGKISEKSASVR